MRPTNSNSFSAQQDPMFLELEPLLDFEGRTICLSTRTPVPVVIDRLLRLDNASKSHDPITLYLLGGDDSEAPQPGAVSALEFLSLYSALRTLRSEIHGMAIGAVLSGFEALALAACTRGRRHILASTMLSIAPLGLESAPGFNPVLCTEAELLQSSQARNMVAEQVESVVAALGLDLANWRTPMLFSATYALKLGIADHVAGIESWTTVRGPQPSTPKVSLPFNGAGH